METLLIQLPCDCRDIHTVRNGRVTYSGYLYNNKGPDFTVEEYCEKFPGLWTETTWEDFDRDYYKPYLQGFESAWAQITKERFWEILEILPPLKWRRGQNIETFYISEATIADLHGVFACIKIGKKNLYFEAVKSIALSDTELRSSLLADIEKLNLEVF